MAVKKPAEESAAEPLAVTEVKESENTDAAGAGFCVYIGPTIIGVIQSGTIYHGSKADALKSIAPAVKKHPLIASLVVSGDTLPEDRIKVKTAGNMLYVNYHKLAAGKK